MDFLQLCICHQEAKNQTFLISDNEDLSTRDLAIKIGNALQLPVRLWPIPISVVKLLLFLLRKSNLYEQTFSSLEVDIKKARVMLRWTPPFSVDESLRIEFSDRV